VEDEKPRIATSAREKCVTRFKELWSIDEMRNIIIPEMSPSIIKILSLGTTKISNHDKLAEILFDCVGQRFLRDIENSVEKRRLFLKQILKAAVDKKIIDTNHLIQLAKQINKSSAYKISTIDDLPEITAHSRWMKQLAIELGFPTTVAEQEEEPEPFQPHESVIPALDLNPLYDYQHSTGIEIRNMLEGNIDDKRILVSVPTGAGKTRMIVETLIEWLNDGKPSKNPQQRNAKFIIWIAQSQELCEQAVSSFKTVFQARGKRGTVLHIHRFWGTSEKKELPVSIDKLDEEFSERTVIVTTNASLSKVASDSPHTMERLADLTSCIIIDEAHRSITDTYNDIIESMGFNIRLRTQELSTKGIVLIGLTATPFRGSGTCGTCSGGKKCLVCNGSGKSHIRHSGAIEQHTQCPTCQGNGQCYTCSGTGKNQETQTLERRYGKIYYPSIPYYENEVNFKPHALIDCQTYGIVNDNIHVIGERSYDRDGFIEEKDFKWKITKLKKFTEIYSKNPTKTLEWSFEKTKNINFVFPSEGEYKITLEVVDNEGDSSESSTIINILPKPKDLVDETNQQKTLYKKLIRRKILCEVKHWILHSDAIKLGDTDITYLKKYREFRPEKITEIGNDPKRNKLILDIISKIKSEYGRKKILFFGCSIEHSREIANALKILYDMKSRYVDSKIGIDQRVDAIEQFRNGDVEVLCNYDVLTTGFDAPNIDCVFVGRPIKSTLLYTQMIGRGLRGAKSGGTDDMLLVDIDDNFQLMGANNHDSQLTELGWKVYAEYWTSWTPQEITPEKPKEHLYQLTCSTCGNSASGIEEIIDIFGPIDDVNLLILSIDNNDVENIPTKCRNCIAKEIEAITSSQESKISKISEISEIPSSETYEKSCPKCGITALGSEQINELFGYRNMDGQLRPQSYCRHCRSEERKTTTSCPFVSFLENQHNIQGNYQMILGKYALYAQENHVPNYVANIDDAIEFLLQHNPEKTRSQINKDHSVFGVYVKNGLIKSIDVVDGTIIFEKIREPKKFLELCDEKIAEYIAKHSMDVAESKSIAFQSSDMLDKHFIKLKESAFGHVPTFRQFDESTSSGIKKLMMELYGSYEEYLKAKGESLADDLKLQDKLYEQYFELYLQARGSFSKETLDEYGDYRVKDYEDCFGSYEKFESTVSELISRTKNIDPTITVDDLIQDYEKIKQNLGHSPHFEELRKLSYLGMEYYLQLFGTYGKFLKMINLNPDDRYFVNQIRTVFYDLKKSLRVVPNLRQMLEYSGYGSKLSEKYDEKTYLEFVKNLDNSKPYDDNDSQTREKIINDLISEFKINTDKFGKEKAVKIFYDAADVVYKEWFGSKENMIVMLSKDDPTLLSIYNTLKHRGDVAYIQQPKISIFSRFKPKKIIKEMNCPMCKSKLDEFDGGYSCTNHDCGYYSFNQ
jgi:superfamily II DNA or RNA helicase/tetratricopeptide (TPR) repeat protein